MKLNKLKENIGEVKVNDRVIDFTYLLSSRRTYQITVFNDGRVCVRVPLRTSYKRVQSIVVEKAEWINKKRNDFAKRPRLTYPEYIDGATHKYLGNSYQLKIVNAAIYKVLLKDNTLVIESPYHKKDDIKFVMEKWYKNQASGIFSAVLDNCWDMFLDWGYVKPSFTIRKMRTRWGSMSSKGSMSLNLDLVKAPYKCIEYVIVHELCHLKHHNHGKGFYAALERRLPDWKELKRALEESRYESS